MTESILTSIKKLLGLTEADTSFDTDIIIHINSVFATLKQLGVGPTKGFRIADAKAKWNEFATDEEFIDSVKTYIYLKVKLVFDPPLNSGIMEAYKQEIKEIEWRLNVDKDTNVETQ